MFYGFGGIFFCGVVFLARIFFFFWVFVWVKCLGGGGACLGLFGWMLLWESVCCFLVWGWHFKFVGVVFFFF